MSFSPVPQGQLHRLLFEHRYALVAANEMAQLPTQLPSFSTAVGVLQDSDELLPRLVDLTHFEKLESANHLHACLEPADGTAGPSIAVLLHSQADAQTLAAHFGRAQLAHSRGGEKAWLRLHDPRVWLQLNRVLSAERLHALMGPVARWTFFLNGQWHAQENVGPGSMSGSFDAITWAAFERMGVVNRVLARVQPGAQTMNELLRTSQRADELAQRAEKVHQIARPDDRVEFCLLGLRVHAQFDEHPRVRSFLDRAAQEPTAFDELLSQDAAFWQNVNQTLNTTGEERK